MLLNNIISCKELYTTIPQLPNGYYKMNKSLEVGFHQIRFDCYAFTFFEDFLALLSLKFSLDNFPNKLVLFSINTFRPRYLQYTLAG